MKDGDVVLLQNTRFRGAEETKNGEAVQQRAGFPGRCIMYAMHSVPLTEHTAPL